MATIRCERHAHADVAAIHAAALACGDLSPEESSSAESTPAESTPVVPCIQTLEDQATNIFRSLARLHRFHVPKEVRGEKLFKNIYTLKLTLFGVDPSRWIVKYFQGSKESVKNELRVSSDAAKIGIAPCLAYISYYGKGDKYEFLLIEEKMDESLFDVLQTRTYSFPECLDMMLQTAKLVQKMHRECKIAHNDVKPENIVRNRSGEIRLIDFGLSRRPSTGTHIYADRTSLEDLSTQTEENRMKKDVWALAMTLAEFLSGTRFFDDYSREAVLSRIRDHDAFIDTIDRALTNNFGIDHSLHARIKMLVFRALIDDPEKRITIDQWVSELEKISSEYEEAYEIGGAASGGGVCTEEEHFATG